ncbi:hypothetical protein K9M41_04480 [Candidatus Gracilibacteria bacterium]|nr:hypothetical protein [Candidatus Gracilibacteria bacterium]
MRKLIIVFSLLLVGCTGISHKEETLPQLPPHIILQNEVGERVGMAVPIKENIFVTADHLREKYGDLYWQEKELEVLARDFDDNLLFLVNESWQGQNGVWSSMPPAVGEEIFWSNPSREGDANISQEQVQSIAQKITEQEQTGKRIIISGTAELPNSGAPVFGRKGQIFGIIIGADKTKNESYAVRGDIIVNILLEHLE